MRDYNKSKIYKLVTNHTTDIYYGSTINPLYLRLSGHKTAYTRWCNGTGQYMSSFEIIKYDDVKIILVEEYPCDNKQQLERKEREYIEHNDCVNKYIPTRERMCEHKRERTQCISCNGSAMCEHKKQRAQCITCDGSAICEHKKQRATCITCNGSGICEHKTRRTQCIRCNGSGLCEHKKQKSCCKDCNGKSTQQTECPLCNKSMRKGTLTRHINTVHEDCDFYNKSKTIYEFTTDSEDEVIE